MVIKNEMSNHFFILNLLNELFNSPVFYISLKGSLIHFNNYIVNNSLLNLIKHRLFKH